MTDIRERYEAAQSAHIEAKAKVATLQTKIDAAQSEANEKRTLAAGADIANEAEIDARAEAIETGVKRAEIALVSADKATEAAHVAEALVKRLQARQTDAANARNGAADDVSHLRKQLNRTVLDDAGRNGGKIAIEKLLDEPVSKLVELYVAARNWNASLLRDEAKGTEVAGQIFGTDDGAIRFSNFIKELVAEPKRATLDDAKARLASEMGL